MPEASASGPRLRPATPADAPALAAILNGVIAEGDKTAIAGPVTARDLDAWYVSGPDALCCILAEAEDGPLGFQALERHHPLPPGWADIATFVAAPARGRGVGPALWRATRASAGGLGLRAVIRSLNGGAIAYYRGCGFRPAGGVPAQVADVPADRTVLVRPPGRA